VIISAWNHDPRLRPSAQNVVGILESIQEEVLALFAAQFSDQMLSTEDAAVVMATSKSERGVATSPMGRSFSGHQAIQRMGELEFVASLGEGIRMGNALMDAGMLHHVKHARSFENSEESYYFDEDNIQLCQPFNAKSFPVLGGNGNSSSCFCENEKAETLTAVSASTRRSRHASHTTVSEQRSGRSGDSSHSGAPLLENGGICACRKFGQRLETTKASRRRFRRNGNKFKPITEENVLTTRLLMEVMDDGDEAGGRGDTGDFDGFDAVVVDVTSA
jgi:hypothetical protein